MYVKKQTRRKNPDDEAGRKIDPGYGSRPRSQYIVLVALQSTAGIRNATDGARGRHRGAAVSRFARFTAGICEIIFELGRSAILHPKA